MKLLDIFRKINELAKTNYTLQKSDHIGFLSACHKELSSYFKDYFGEKFIFSALSYSKNNKLHHVDEDKGTSYIFNENHVNNWQELNVELRTYIDEINQDKMISITKTLLDKSASSQHKDLFFTKSLETKYNNIITENFIFEYALKEFEEDYCKYKTRDKNLLECFYNEYKIRNQSQELYDRYIWNHHKLANKYSSDNKNNDFNLHYVKPFVTELDYGILLSLATNRLLTADELAIINLILYRIVSQTAIEKILEIERLKTKTMFSLTTHSLKTHLSTTVIKTKNAFDDKLNAFFNF